MQVERNYINNIELTVSNNKKLWVRAFVIYALAEALFLSITYFITYSQCKRCVFPLPFYIWQSLANLALTILFGYLLSYFYNKPLWKIVLLNCIIFLLYYFLYAGMLYGILNSGQDWLLGRGFKPRNFEWIVYGSWFDIGKYVLKITAFYVIKFYSQYLNAVQQRIQLAVVNKDMQLNLLKQQLSPHFYFNTLNNLYGLSRSDNPQLSKALNQLSNIMQYVISDCTQPKVLLEQEIKFLQSYIELEKLRYEKGTVIEMKVEGKVSGQTIIPLMLIQFVENAFKHGMKEKSDRSWMRVGMAVSDNELLFKVENSYYGHLPSQGIGINSVKNILSLQYENRHDIQMKHEDNSFAVTLKLNLV